MTRTFHVSVPAGTLSKDEFVAWMEPKMLLQGVVHRHILNSRVGMPNSAVVQIHPEVFICVPETKVSWHPDIKLLEALPVGKQVIVEVDELNGDEGFWGNTRSFTVPWRELQAVESGEILRGRVYCHLTRANGNESSGALVALSNGMIGTISAHTFRNHKVFPLDRRLPIGTTLDFTVNSSPTYNGHIVNLNPHAQIKLVFNQLHRRGKNTVVTGVVSGKNSSHGHYYVTVNGVLDGVLFPEQLKTVPCECPRCNATHFEELTIGEEIQVRVQDIDEPFSGARSEGRTGYRLVFSRKDVD